MQITSRIAMTLAALGTAASSHAHDNPITHTHGASGTLLALALIAGACTLAVVALQQARAAQRKRARQAIPVVILRPGLRLFRDR